MSYRYAHIAIAGLLLMMSPAARAQSDPKLFYQGKSVNMLIGYPAGGTYDLYARTIARHLGKHLSPDTKVVSQNMPGAATLQVARHVYNVAPQDGTNIAALSSSMPFLSLFQEADPVYNPIKANWLPTPSSFTTLMIVWHKVPVKTVEDLRARDTIMSTLAPGATPHFMASVVNVVLGTKIKSVTGFTNMNASLLAMERGEMEGYPTVPMSAILRTYAKQWKSGEFRPLIQIGAKKDKDAGDVPLLRDIVKSEEDKRLVDLATSPLALGYPYMMGPGVPSERVALMRRAFMDVFEDNDFLAEAQKLTLEMDPVDGDKVQAMISHAHNAPAPMRAKLRAIFDGKHN